MFTNSPPGIFTGLPEIRPWSLANAMFEPQKEIEPTIAPNSSGIPTASSSERLPPAWRNSAHAISATAPPPTPLNSATICGIAVIFTLRALGMPIAVPMTRPMAIRRKSAPSRSGFSSVAITAIAMPTAAILLPCTAVVGLVSRARPMMKRLNATMYAATMKFGSCRKIVAVMASRRRRSRPRRPSPRACA